MDNTLDAEQIAEQLGINIHTVRRWFRRGRLPGRKIGRHGWQTTTTALDAFLATLDDPETYDTTAEQLAAELDVSLPMVRGWFAHHGAPGAKVRGLGERAATWRTRREDFDAWFADYLTTNPRSG